MTEEPLNQEPAQETAKQEDGPAAPGRDSTRPVMIIVGACVLLAVGFVVVMTTGTSSKSADSQPTTTPATATTAGGAGAKVAAATIAAQGDPAAAGSSPHQIAGALRRDATVACRSAQWDKCRADLEQSAQLDPEGDKIVQVQKLHRMAEQRGQ